MRRLLDTFGDSLRFVNALFHAAYGKAMRKVPAHMPHFMDKNIMAELQAKVCLVIFLCVIGLHRPCPCIRLCISVNLLSTPLSLLFPFRYHPPFQLL